MTMTMTMSTAMSTAMTAEGEGRALLRLLAWLSPSFPTGAFSYSHGLEWAVEAGLVRDRDTLVAWVRSLLEHGAARVDAALFAAAHRAVEGGDAAAFDRAAERAAVTRGTRELALESAAQGAAFLATVRAAWPDPGVEAWSARIAEAGREPAHCVAVALAAACAGIPLAPALAGFLHAFVANLVSAGVRLVPLGQTDGQRALAALEGAALDAARAATRLPPEDLGARAPVADWTSLRHETQYTRLFRS
jgi:urease accessory protein